MRHYPNCTVLWPSVRRRQDCLTSTEVRHITVHSINAAHPGVCAAGSNQDPHPRTPCRVGRQHAHSTRSHGVGLVAQGAQRKTSAEELNRAGGCLLCAGSCMVVATLPDIVAIKCILVNSITRTGRLVGLACSTHRNRKRERRMKGLSWKRAGSAVLARLTRLSAPYSSSNRWSTQRRASEMMPKQMQGHAERPRRAGWLHITIHGQATCTQPLRQVGTMRSDLWVVVAGQWDRGGRATLPVGCGWVRGARKQRLLCRLKSLLETWPTESRPNRDTDRVVSLMQGKGCACRRDYGKLHARRSVGTQI
jgi:hypothetical protein